MIDRKIGNPVSKESKTAPSNRGTRKTGAPAEGATGESSEQASDAWSTDPLESLMEDYLQQSESPEPPRKAPLRKSRAICAGRAGLTEVEAETVREYKKYMQTPAVFRETLVKWRKRSIQERFKNSASHEGPKWKRLQMEHDFLGTLGFYSAVKEKVLSPLLSMQVG